MTGVSISRQLQQKPTRLLGFFEDTSSTVPLRLKRSRTEPYEKGDVATLEKVQRRAARFVKGDYKRESSVKQIICDLGWQSLEARRAVSRLSLMYKIAHGLVDVESQILVRSGRATRQSQGQHYRNILALKSCYRASFFHALSPSGIICPLIFGMLFLLTALSPPSCETKTLTI